MKSYKHIYNKLWLILKIVIVLAIIEFAYMLIRNFYDGYPLTAHSFIWGMLNTIKYVALIVLFILVLGKFKHKNK